MQTKKNLSIALCTYNGAPYLEGQLESIAAQTLQPDELVVCDDGSTDSTLELLSDFKGRVPFDVRIYRNITNLGSTRNFEQAITLCEGEIIALSDQDDIWLPEKLEKLVKALSDNPETAFAFSDAEVVDDQLRPMHYRLWESGNVQFSRRLQNRFRKHGPLDVLIKRYIVTGATMVFRSSLKDIILPIQTSWVHDGWIAFIAAAIGKNGEFVDEPLILYRQHTNQQIGASKPARQRGHVLSAYDFILVRIAAWFNGQTIPTPVFCYDRMEDVEAAIRERATALNIGDKVARSIELVGGKIRHEKKRKEIIAKRRIARLWPVMVEILKGNYSRYTSNIILQCGKDILF